jgi:hypothetical protein
VAWADGIFSGVVRISFRLLDAEGWIDVALESNTDPAAVGCPPFARGFPVCTATVAYEGRGYRAAFGWVQLVRSTDNASRGEEFEMDPYSPLGRLPHPFCFFGFAPILFDAPMRDSREDMDWIANSFLCFVAPSFLAPDAGGGPEARAVAGFAWGFRVQNGDVVSRPAESLGSATWDSHLPLLRSEHPSWAFATGFCER